MKGQKQSALLLMVMIFVLGGGFTYWQYSVMKGVQARLAILEEEVPTKEEVDQQLTQTRTEMEQFQQQLSHLERGVPPVAYIPTMLSELEALGKQYNIKVTGVKPALDATPAPKDADAGDGAPKPKKTYTEVEIDMTGTGRYGDFLAFVEAVKQFPKIVSVRTVQFVPRKEPNEAAQNLLDATLRLKVYVFEVKPKEVTTPSPLTTLETTSAGGQS